MTTLTGSAKLVLSAPNTCWKKLTKNSVKDASIFFGLSLIVMMILNAAISILYLGQNLAETATGLGFGLFYGVLATIIGAWVYNLVLNKLANNVNTTSDAFKVMAYSITPNVLLGWIPLVGFIGLVWTLIVQILGLKSVYNTTVLKVIIAMIVVSIIVTIPAIALAMTLGPEFVA